MVKTTAKDIVTCRLDIVGTSQSALIRSCNATASGGAAAAGNGSGDGKVGGEDGEDGGNGTAAGVAESEGAAGHVTVLSSVGLVLVGVSSLMALL